MSVHAYESAIIVFSSMKVASNLLGRKEIHPEPRDFHELLNNERAELCIAIVGTVSAFCMQ